MTPLGETLSSEWMFRVEVINTGIEIDSCKSAKFRALLTTFIGFYPYAANTQGYVSVDVVEKIWWDRFEWLWENECWLDETEGYGSIFPLIWHPESAGRAHIIGMIDRFLGRLSDKARAADAGEITFETMESVARAWRKQT